MLDLEAVYKVKNGGLFRRCLKLLSCARGGQGRCVGVGGKGRVWSLDVLTFDGKERNGGSGNGRASG